MVKILANSIHIFWEKKVPQKCLFMDAALPPKHLKIFNLTTTNATIIKLTTNIYLYRTFNLAEDWGVTHRE